VLEAYRPCAKELQRERIKRMMLIEEERRKILNAKARVLSATEARKE
jgi:hypothetical protein